MIRQPPPRPSLAGPASSQPPSSAGSPRRRRHEKGEILADKYEITGFLGEGGMGTVWRARNLPLDIDVAIKVLNRDYTDQRAAERLLREGRATARLGHPAIVRVFDLGETPEGDPFLVMELLEGQSLARWLEAGPLSADLAVQILLPIASGLAAAHAQGIVHRDIKPENIVLVSDGEEGHLPKLLDFGIAKVRRRGGDVLTEAGAILGSIQYMAPEQAEGDEDVGERADVWSFTVVLYELVTGARPFEGPNLQTTVFSLYHRDPKPTFELSAGDKELWAIIERGLKKKPAERWPTMRALGQELASWAIERGIATDVAGVSLAHHWLSRSSAPPMDEGGAPVSAIRAALPQRISTAPILMPGAESTRRSEPTYVPRGTIELPLARGERASAAPAPADRRRTTPFFVGLLVVMLLAPALLILAGRYVRGTAIAGSTAPRPPSTPARARAPAPAPAMIPTDTAIPDATAAPKGTPAEAPEATSRAPGTARARLRSTPPAMPIPSEPDF